MAGYLQSFFMWITATSVPNCQPRWRCDAIGCDFKTFRWEKASLKLHLSKLHSRNVDPNEISPSWSAELQERFLTQFERAFPSKSRVVAQAKAVEEKKTRSEDAAARRQDAPPPKKKACSQTKKQSPKERHQVCLRKFGFEQPSKDQTSSENFRKNRAELEEVVACAFIPWPKKDNDFDSRAAQDTVKAAKEAIILYGSLDGQKYDNKLKYWEMCLTAAIATRQRDFCGCQIEERDVERLQFLVQQVLGKRKAKSMSLS